MCQWWIIQRLHSLFKAPSSLFSNNSSSSLLLTFFLPPSPHCSTSLFPPSIHPYFLFLFPRPARSSEVRWSRQMMILSVSAPVPASRPSEASVLGGRCPRARLDWWGRRETRCHGTCPNTRGGRGRARTRCWTRQRGRWFVSQVRETSHTQPVSSIVPLSTVLKLHLLRWWLATGRLRAFSGARVRRFDCEEVSVRVSVWCRVSWRPSSLFS